MIRGGENLNASVLRIVFPSSFAINCMGQHLMLKIATRPSEPVIGHPADINLPIILTLRSEATIIKEIDNVDHISRDIKSADRTAR